MRMLDLFCGRWGWSKAFAARGWECIGVDLVEPPEIPDGCEFVKANILGETFVQVFTGWQPDFICASSPCEEFSVHGMKHFHPNPKYPEIGIRLFDHTRVLCEASGLPYVMENVRAAQKFVGKAVNHCGSFYLWGTGVPPLLHRGITKGFETFTGKMTKSGRRQSRGRYDGHSSRGDEDTARFATIPPELAGCVADYATRICAERVSA